MMVQRDLFSAVVMEEAQKPDLSKHCPPYRPCPHHECRYHTGNRDASLSCALDLAMLDGLSRGSIAAVMDLPVETVAEIERTAVIKLRRKVKRNG